MKRAMQPHPRKNLASLLEYIPIRAALALGGLLPFGLRGRFFAWLGGVVVARLPPVRRRAEAGLRRVFPDMDAATLRKTCRAVGRNSARTLSEILFNADYKTRLELFHASGPGLDALRTAHAAGKGAIVVSGHFGQWEAIRHYLKSQGMETGAVYRKNSNPWYEVRFLDNIRHGGQPIVARGPGGNRTMIRHLRSGGFFALLVDQKYQSGELIPFLGHPALTPTAAAELALRYDLPLVPAYGIRGADGQSIDIEFEAPIPHSDPLTMTRSINDSLSARILERPEQWYWLHQRWDDIELYDYLRGGGPQSS